MGRTRPCDSNATSPSELIETLLTIERTSAQALRELRATLGVLHGTDDNVIPAVESALLAQTLREAGVDVRQLATPLITHAEVDRSAAARAMWDLVRFWADLLDEE